MVNVSHQTRSGSESVARTPLLYDCFQIPAGLCGLLSGLTEESTHKVDGELPSVIDKLLLNTRHCLVTGNGRFTATFCASFGIDEECDQDLEVC